MKFTISNWYKQIILSIAIINVYKYIPSSIATPTQAAATLEAIVVPETSYLPQVQKTIARNISNCSSVAPSYQEIYSFETENHYISICQQGGNYYYHRQSKLNPQHDLLVPAQPVFGGSVFQAIDGKTIYFVGQNGDRHYSSVMQNNDEMVFEPELVPTPSFARATLDGKIDFSFSQVKLSNFLDRYEESEALTVSAKDKNQSRAPICIQEESATSSLAEWHNLLGKSTIAANIYALDRGHHFVYNRHTPEQALIKTKEGTIVNLGIAAHSKTISEVCIQPIGNI